MVTLRRSSNSAPEADGLLGPDSVETFPRRIRSGDSWCETLAVFGYPREITAGWLAPLLSYPGPIDVALHVEPLPNDLAAGRLKRQRARFESTLQADAARSRISDPEIQAAASDARQLMSDLATGEGRLFRVGLYISVRGCSERELDIEVGRVRSLCSSLLMDTPAGLAITERFCAEFCSLFAPFLLPARGRVTQDLYDIGRKCA